MNVPRRTLLVGGAAVALSACSSKFKKYEGPEVTRVMIVKQRRRLYLFNNRDLLDAYDVHLGFRAEGPKQFRGDGKTPEGTYYIDRRNPRSSYHLSLGISYPNSRDVAFARAQGRDPGGDIFIHGWRNKDSKKGKDWTAGCIAVKDREMEDIYSMVRIGTPIHIYA
ncbi:L,D-transpeptidase-like protein [Aliiruegeria haliotis]|uniref:L,D-transpeptidase-like protein n=1 Tax=Aliiruegeria haliotis TaxID=1280846 RepID=A0A2T0RHH5_9RHOB|nr:L,D-transpeptidase family protein [Aliiruegeria haliotis]PRY20656.1 L,D-transpeptidase-like protein [Aliiruegeria haliotis]